MFLPLHPGKQTKTIYLNKQKKKKKKKKKKTKKKKKKEERNGSVALLVCGGQNYSPPEPGSKGRRKGQEPSCTTPRSTPKLLYPTRLYLLKSSITAQ
jgi:hypothetical protein